MRERSGWIAMVAVLALLSAGRTAVAASWQAAGDLGKANCGVR